MLLVLPCRPGLARPLAFASVAYTLGIPVLGACLQLLLRTSNSQRRHTAYVGMWLGCSVFHRFGLPHTPRNYLSCSASFSSSMQSCNDWMCPCSSVTKSSYSPRVNCVDKSPIRLCTLRYASSAFICFSASSKSPGPDRSYAGVRTDRIHAPCADTTRHGCWAGIGIPCRIRIQIPWDASPAIVAASDAALRLVSSRILRPCASPVSFHSVRLARTIPANVVGRAVVVMKTTTCLKSRPR